MSISITIASLRMRSPVILSSGVLGSRYGTINRVIKNTLVGAVVTKTFTKEPREGYLTPIVAYTEAGLVNAVGLANPGIDNLKEILLNIVKEVPVIVSIASSTPREFAEMSIKAEEAGADAVELNLSCPHVKGHGLEVGQDPKYVREIVENVKSVLKIPVFAKLGLNDKVIESAKEAEKAGVDAITAINSVRAMVIDIYAKKPVLSNKYGGLSGPAIHPIAVRVVYDLYKNIEVPIIGVGGITKWEDAVELILAGASAIAVASAIALKGISVINEIVEGIVSYLRSEGYSSLEEIIGLAHKN